MNLSLRPLLPKETDWEKLAVFLIPATAAIGLLWLKLGLPTPPCTLKHSTGFPCAGCGGTRASTALAHGHFGEALTLNPMVTAGYAALTAYWLYAAYVMIAKPGRRLRFDGVPRHTGILARVGIGAAFAANWIWVLTHLPESPWRVQ